MVAADVRRRILAREMAEMSASLRWRLRVRGILKHALTPFPSIIDAHHSPQQIDHGHPLALKLLHLCGDSTLGWIIPERLKNVSVGLGVMAESFPKHRQDPTQIAEVNPSPECVCRFAKIQNQ